MIEVVRDGVRSIEIVGHGPDTSGCSCGNGTPITEDRAGMTRSARRRLRRLRELYQTGHYTHVTLAAHLNALGVPSVHGGKVAPFDGGEGVAGGVGSRPAQLAEPKTGPETERGIQKLLAQS
jgi:hypothetical protein